MTRIHVLGAAAAALLLCNVTTASAQSSGHAAPTDTAVAATSTAPLVPGGAAGAPAHNSFDSFWASLTGKTARDDASTAQTAANDTNAKAANAQ